MNYPLPGVLVDPQGVSTSVAITDSHGNTPTVYADRFAVTTITMPDTITARKTYYLPGEGPWTVTPTANGEVTAATTLTLEDAQIATVTVGSAFTAGQWSQLGAYASVLSANGATDGTAINAALAVGSVKLKAGGTFVIDTAIVIPSNRTLDISGATVQRGGSFNNGYLVCNNAALPLRSVTDAAITASSTTLTSATAAFTAADVGRAVTVVGAGSLNNSIQGDLYTTIASVTNGTTAVLTVAAVTTVTNATLDIYTRDSNINLIADKASILDDGAGAGSGTGNVPWYSTYFRRVDGIRILGGGAQTKSQTGGGHVFFSVGDATDFRCDDWVFGGSNPAGGVQPCGPLNVFAITNVRGTTTDDTVALQGSNAGWTPNDVQGDITNGYIGQVQATSTNGSLVKIFGGLTNANVDTKIRGITVEGVRGSTGNHGVQVESDRAGVTNADDVTIRDVRVTVPSGYQAVMESVGSGSGTLNIEDVTSVGTSGTAGTPLYLIQLAGGANTIKVSGVGIPSGTNYVDVVHVGGGNTQDTLFIENISVPSGTTSTNILAVDSGSTVNAAFFANVRMNGTGSVLSNSGTVNQIYSIGQSDGLGTAISVAGAVQAKGSNAGLQFTDRGSGVNWQWYATGGSARLYDGSADMITVDTNNNTTLGNSAPATNATNGFPYLPVVAGAPTGTPTAKTGYAPVVFDSTNNKIWVYLGGAWKGVAVA